MSAEDLGPDYAALFKTLFTLKRLPDTIGETTLTPEEASEICSLGFAASPGRWRVPPLPPDLTRDTSFEGWSAGWFASRVETQAIARITEEDGAREEKIPLCDERNDADEPQQLSGKILSLLERRMIRAVEKAGGKIAKRRLQKKTVEDARGTVSPHPRGSHPGRLPPNRGASGCAVSGASGPQTPQRSTPVFPVPTKTFHGTCG